ncbi:hypothetical protein CEXT_168751 [Caerostris extrusa]|uniref:Uncharacterized protein n=1 Tax=Caerostris extrusa TaxID=172846 RepID=A0AAV4NNV0_CAEEX|nr:hypothetical protein CEXT_168751 [Caerostris extrusa]
MVGKVHEIKGQDQVCPSSSIFINCDLACCGCCPSCLRQMRTPPRLQHPHLFPDRKSGSCGQNSQMPARY